MALTLGEVHHPTRWGLAAIVVVIVSWLMYRYLAPRSWKEWTRAGALQRFIIAFYAEMYGFPLTIYFLARFFGLDLAWTEGGNGKIAKSPARASRPAAGPPSRRTGDRPVAAQSTSAGSSRQSAVAPSAEPLCVRM